jgi:hypothetical protein
LADDLDAAVQKIPASLRKEMQDLLRAEFRELRPYRPR